TLPGAVVADSPAVHCDRREQHEPRFGPARGDLVLNPASATLGRQPVARARHAFAGITCERGKAVIHRIAARLARAHVAAIGRAIFVPATRNTRAVLTLIGIGTVTFRVARRLACCRGAFEGRTDHCFDRWTASRTIALGLELGDSKAAACLSTA